MLVQVALAGNVFLLGAIYVYTTIHYVPIWAKESKES